MYIPFSIAVTSKKHRQQKLKIDKKNYIKIKRFFTAKESIVKRQPREWEKRSANHVSYKSLVSKIDKDFLQLISKNNNNKIN